MPSKIPPSFAGLGDTESEQAAVWSQLGLLSQLALYLDAYEAALILGERSTASIETLLPQRQAALAARIGFSDGRDNANQILAEMNLHARWVNIAGRDAVMTVFHLGKTLDAIGFKGSPSLARAVDGKRLSSARSRFKQSFRNHEQARNAVGHAAERHSNRAATERITHAGEFETPNITITDGSSYSLTNVIEGDRMTSTVAHPHTGETSMASVPLSRNALRELGDIVDEVFAAFEGAEKARHEHILRSGI